MRRILLPDCYPGPRAPRFAAPDPEAHERFTRRLRRRTTPLGRGRPRRRSGTCLASAGGGTGFSRSWRWQRRSTSAPPRFIDFASLANCRTCASSTRFEFAQRTWQRSQLEGDLSEGGRCVRAAKVAAGSIPPISSGRNAAPLTHGSPMMLHPHHARPQSQNLFGTSSWVDGGSHA